MIASGAGYPFTSVRCFLLDLTYNAITDPQPRGIAERETMRLSDYRHNEPKPGLTRQVMLGSLFLYLTGCNLTGINNPLQYTEPQWIVADEPGETTLQPAGELKALPAHSPSHVL